MYHSIYTAYISQRSISSHGFIMRGVMSRRTFCLTGIATIASPLAGRCFAAIDETSCSAPPILAVVFDERFSMSRSFAYCLKRLGVALFPVEGNTAALWYG